MRVWITLATVGALAAGCGPGTSGVPLTSGWAEPSHYAFTLRSECGESLVHGTMRLTVKDGEVVMAEGLDEPGRATVEVAKPANLPSLKELLAEYEIVVRAGADVAEIEFDPGDGHPTRIHLDPLRNAIDDEACYQISDYSVG